MEDSSGEVLVEQGLKNSSCETLVKRGNDECNDDDDDDDDDDVGGEVVHLTVVTNSLNNNPPGSEASVLTPEAEKQNDRATSQVRARTPADHTAPHPCQP